MEGVVPAVEQAKGQLDALQRGADGLLLALSGGGLGKGRVDSALAEGKDALASLQKLSAQLGPLLAVEPPTLPRGAVEALWDRELPGGSKALPAACPPQPARSLAELTSRLNAISGLQATLMSGKEPAPGPAAATAVALRCGDAVCAVVHLREPGAMRPLRVAAFGPAELGPSAPGAAPASPWGQSQHLVFQQVTAVAAAALRHFDRAAAAESGGGEQCSALEALLLWLASYSDLFRRPCAASGRLLAPDPRHGALLPPVLRPYQGASWQELYRAAADPSRRTAYHPAAAPAGALA